MAWHDRGTYWELDAPQLSPVWEAARYGRVRGSDVLSICKGGYNVQKALGEPRLNVDVTAPGIVNEPKAREWQRAHLPPGYVLRSASFCVPKLTAPQFAWVKPEDVLGLLHIGCSPDDFIVSAQGQTFKIAEYKCPKEMYQYLRIERHRIDKRHWSQIQFNLGVVMSGLRVIPACSYVVWTEDDVHQEDVIFNEQHFRNTMNSVLPVIRHRIMPNVDLAKFMLPDEIKDFYLKAVRR